MQLTPPSTAASIAAREECSCWWPQLIDQCPGTEPIGAVPTPTREISSPLVPSVRVSMCGRTRKVTTIFRPDDEARVRELLAELSRPVELVVAHGPEESPLVGAARDVDFGAETEKVVRGLTELSELLSVRVEDEPPGFERYPAVSVQPEGRDVGVR